MLKGKLSLLSKRPTINFPLSILICKSTKVVFKFLSVIYHIKAFNRSKQSSLALLRSFFFWRVHPFTFVMVWKKIGKECWWGITELSLDIPMVWQKIFKLMAKKQFDSKYDIPSFISSLLKYILWSLGSLEQRTLNLEMVINLCSTLLKQNSFIHLCKTFMGYLRIQSRKIKGAHRFSFISFIQHVYGLLFCTTQNVLTPVKNQHLSTQGIIQKKYGCIGFWKSPKWLQLGVSGGALTAPAPSPHPPLPTPQEV